MICILLNPAVRIIFPDNLAISEGINLRRPLKQNVNTFLFAFEPQPKSGRQMYNFPYNENCKRMIQGELLREEPRMDKFNNQQRGVKLLL